MGSREPSPWIGVPYPAGGGADILARAVAQKLRDNWRQPVSVDNRSGANTLIGCENVARATDGRVAPPPEAFARPVLEERAPRAGPIRSSGARVD